MNNKNNHAVYTASPVSDYQGNPFIEALPVIFEAKDKLSLKSKHVFFSELV